MPPFSILKTDSTILTNEGLAKDKNELIMIFSPGCGHCRQQTDSLIGNINKLRDVEIKEFHLEGYENIILGRDIRYFLTPFYRPAGIPFLALYDKKGKLLTAYEGFTPVARILAAFGE